VNRKSNSPFPVKVRTFYCKHRTTSHHKGTGKLLSNFKLLHWKCLRSSNGICIRKWFISGHNCG